MVVNNTGSERPQILYSCYYAKNREGEHFIPDHVLSFQLSGTLTVNEGGKEYVFREGDIRLSRRNHLVKFIKQPPDGGEFRSVSVYLDQATLQAFAMEYGYKAGPHMLHEAVLQLRPHKLYQGYMDSLLPYLQVAQSGNEQLLAIKLKEAIMILLKAEPALKDVLFDFTEPGKTDLEAFMNKNFHFNVEMKRFAYLTGRSLATFKRDFEKIFHATPGKWLQQKRLQEAHYLIKDRGRAPSDVYLELGFEDLSHFSFVFKKMYGVAPSRL